MKNWIVVLAAILISSVVSAQELVLTCDVKTVLDTSGVGVKEEQKKITLKIDTKTGVVDGGIAGHFTMFERFYPTVSEEKFSGVAEGRVNGSADLVVLPSARYEVNRYSGAYTVSVNLLAYGKLQTQSEIGTCTQSQRKF